MPDSYKSAAETGNLFLGFNSAAETGNLFLGLNSALETGNKITCSHITRCTILFRRNRRSTGSRYLMADAAPTTFMRACSRLGANPKRSVPAAATASEIIAPPGATDRSGSCVSSGS